jgi:glyoxylase-like metal-dependent hydrolase (beta-lactamase superfamily II)
LHEVIVLVPGFVGVQQGQSYLAGGTVTLIKGNPNVVVDTGDVWQRAQIVAALAEHGTAADDVQWVINTHGHLDHVGNNNLFPAATFVLDGDLARDGTYWTHDFSRGPLSIAVGSDDGAITIMFTPGHTDHDLSVIVPASIGVVAVVGDLFEHAADDLGGVWERWSRDVPRQRKSRAAVRALADYIVPGHGGIFRVER